MKEINLRPINEKDKDFIYKVKKITLKSYVEQIWGVWDEEFQITRFNQNYIPENFQIIQYKGENIGILAVQEELEYTMIDNIEILPDYQNRGIGTDLLQKIIKNAMMKKKIIRLQVYKINHKALKFYRRLGFKTFQETDTHFQLEQTPKLLLL